MSQQREPGARQALRDSFLTGFVQMLSIDPEWMHQYGEVFDWWAYRLRQRIEMGELQDSRGHQVARLAIRTRLTRPLNPVPSLLAAIAAMNQDATLFAWIWDVHTACVELVSTLDIHETAVPYCARLAATASALQVAAAEAAYDGGWANLSAEDFALSGHPVNGRREEPDEILSLADTFRYQVPTDIGDRLGANSLATIAHLQQVGVQASEGTQSFVAEFPCLGSEPAMTVMMEGGPVQTALHICEPDDHVALGPVLCRTLHLPMQPPELSAYVLNDINVRQLSAPPGLHNLGAWTEGPEGLQHLSQMPLVLHDQGLMITLAFTTAVIAQFAGDWLKEESAQYKAHHSQ